jgi:hypothetical protein
LRILGRFDGTFRPRHPLRPLPRLKQGMMMMANPRDPHPPRASAPRHEPRAAGRPADEPVKRDPPGKPFRTPAKNKTHPAPETATDADPDLGRPKRG